MNNSPLFKGVVLLVIISMLFISIPPAEAVMLPLHYAGLTFLQPPMGKRKNMKSLTLQFTLPKTPQILLSKKKTLLTASFAQLVPTDVLNEVPLPTILATMIATPIPISPPPTPTLLPVSPSPTTVVTAASPAPQAQAIATSPSNPGGLNPDKLFGLVNAYRQTKGLASFQKDDKSCQLASSRAPEIAEEVTNGHMHSGLRDRNLPYWNSENIISYNSEEGAFNWWINDTIHREQIEGKYTYSCIACSGNSCAEEFTNYQAK